MRIRLRHAGNSTSAHSRSRPSQLSALASPQSRPVPDRDWLERRVYGVPPAIDAEVARLKLAAFGINLDGMTPEQAEYVTAWKHGT